MAEFEISNEVDVLTLVHRHGCAKFYYVSFWFSVKTSPYCPVGINVFVCSILWWDLCWDLNQSYGWSWRLPDSKNVTDTPDFSCPIVQKLLYRLDQNQYEYSQRSHNSALSFNPCSYGTVFSSHQGLFNETLIIPSHAKKYNNFYKNFELKD